MFTNILEILFKIGGWESSQKRSTEGRVLQFLNSETGFVKTIDIKVDFLITEPEPFPSTWFSHKTVDGGLRYEVDVSIRTSVVVSTHGPFPCDSNIDIIIFCIDVKNMFMESGKHSKIKDVPTVMFLPAISRKVPLGKTGNRE